MPGRYEGLPGAGPPTKSLPQKVVMLMRRKPLLSVSLSLCTLITVYISLSGSSNAVPNLPGPFSPTWYTNKDQSSEYGSARERMRCEALWREDGRIVNGMENPLTGEPPVKSGPLVHGGLTSSGDSQATGGFSTEAEIAKGRSKLEVLEEMVSKTQGFYVRDYSLWLGWNNIRYIIEASLLHAELTNRVLVVPSVVYARACDFEPQTCQAFAKMVNRGDALESDEWRHDPIEKQWAWLIPIELMIDLPAIRRHRPVITLADYFLLKGLDPKIETAKGNWDRLNYMPEGTTFHMIPNRDYDTDISRVNKMPAGMTQLSISEEAKNSPLGRRIREIMEGKATEDWMTIVDQVGNGESDAELEKKLLEVGCITLHTWQGSHGMEYVRTVTDPIKQVSMVEKTKGFWDDYKDIDAEVLLLEGETHYWRKPGSVRFTTIQAQTDFARMVLYDIMGPAFLNKLAHKLDLKMREKVGGRMWMGAHMRRGDFVHHEWVMNSDAYAHFERIKKYMGEGRKVLQKIHNAKDMQVYPVPSASIASDFERGVPLPDDPFYIATDERNATQIAYMKGHGAVFLNDLLSADDRREAGWPLVYTDVLGILEQTILSKSSYFYGHALSSVAGGTLNYRAANGKDPRTALID